MGGCYDISTAVDVCWIPKMLSAHSPLVLYPQCLLLKQDYVCKAGRLTRTVPTIAVPVPSGIYKVQCKVSKRKAKILVLCTSVLDEKVNRYVPGF